MHTALRRSDKVAHKISYANGDVGVNLGRERRPQCPGWLGPDFGWRKFLRADVGSAAGPVVLLVKDPDNEEELER